MSAPYELLGASGDVSISGPKASGEHTWRYACELGPQHVDPAILPRISTPNAQRGYDEWLKYLDDGEDPLGYTADWIRATIRQIPSGIDIARDVDDGGATKDRVQPAMFTAWVELEDGSHVRFSEARTAMHNPSMAPYGIRNGALRSPVMGGVALEVTSNPLSNDPRDAVTLAIYEFAREKNANFPWLPAHPGRLFDFTPFAETPYSVGPLYDGHPNQVRDPADIDKAVKAAISVLRLTVDFHLANQ